MVFLGRQQYKFEVKAVGADNFHGKLGTTKLQLSSIKVGVWLARIREEAKLGVELYCNRGLFPVAEKRL